MKRDTFENIYKNLSDILYYKITIILFTEAKSYIQFLVFNWLQYLE